MEFERLARGAGGCDRVGGGARGDAREPDTTARRTAGSGSGHDPMRETWRATVVPRARRRRYRIHPGWPVVANSIVRELADLLLTPKPEVPFALLEPEDLNRWCRHAGSLHMDTAAGT